MLTALEIFRDAPPTNARLGGGANDVNCTEVEVVWLSTVATTVKTYATDSELK